MVHHRLTTTMIFFLGFLLVKHGLTMMSSSAQAHPVVINGGRKVVMGQREVKEISSKLSGATSIDHGLFGVKKRDFNGKTPLGDDKTNVHKKAMGGFVAFSADYHGPKHHNPKHN